MNTITVITYEICNHELLSYNNSGHDDIGLTSAFANHSMDLSPDFCVFT